MSKLRSILRIPCTCPTCGWRGLTGDTEPDVDGEGSPGCPACFCDGERVPVTVEYNEQERNPKAAP